MPVKASHTDTSQDLSVVGARYHMPGFMTKAVIRSVIVVSAFGATLSTAKHVITRPLSQNAFLATNVSVKTNEFHPTHNTCWVVLFYIAFLASLAIFLRKETISAGVSFSALPRRVMRTGYIPENQSVSHLRCV